MRPSELTPKRGSGGTVEADHTFIGREPGFDAKKGGFAHKIKVLFPLDRETGEKRSMVGDKITTAEITPILFHFAGFSAR